MRVSTNPGHTAFTVMPRPPTSLASERVSPTRPAFDAVYAAWPAFPRRAATEATFTIRPHRAFSIAGRPRREHRKAPLRFVSIVASQFSVVYFTAKQS